MLREDAFDIDMRVLETFVPALGVVSCMLKTKTTKTP